MPPKSRVNECFCCTAHSREADDAKLATEVLPLAPPEEWNIPWDATKLLPHTGSKDLDNFFVLKRIFLFLPLDLTTVLAVASACTSWRILSDRLPHWKFLLPLRNEVMPIASHMQWHRPSQWTRKYFEVVKPHPANPAVNIVERHYHYVRSGGLGERFFLSPLKNGVKACGKAFCETVCCDACSSGCCSSSCSCSSAEDQRERTEAEDIKRRQFLETNNKRRALLELRQGEDIELAHQAFAPHRKVVDWMKRLQDDFEERKARKERKSKSKNVTDNNENSSFEDNNKNRTSHHRRRHRHDRRNNEKGNTAPDQFRYPNNNTTSSSSSVQQENTELLANNNNHSFGLSDSDNHQHHSRANYNGNDDDDEADQENQTTKPNEKQTKNQLQTFPIFEHDDSLEGYMSNNNFRNISLPTTPQKNKAKTYHTANNTNTDAAPATSASTRVPSSKNDNERTRRDNNGDDDESTSSSSSSSSSSTEKSNGWTPQVPHGDNDDEEVQEGEGMQHTVSLDPTTVQEASIKRITARDALTYSQRRRLSKDELDNLPIRYSHQTLIKNQQAIMAGFHYRQEWMFGSLSSYLQFCNEAKRRFQIEGRVGCREFHGPTLRIQFFLTILLAVCVGFATLYGFFVDRTNMGERSDGNILKTLSLIIGLGLLPVFLFCAWIHVIVKYDDSEQRRDASFMKAVSFIAVTGVLCTFCIPLALIGFRIYSADLLLNGGSISVCEAMPKVSNKNNDSFFFGSIVNNNNNNNNSVFDQPQQCNLPQQYLPEKFMSSTFLHLPPGTKILFHPSKFDSRIIPYSAKTTNNSHFIHNNYSCQISENEEIRNLDDLGFNDSQQIISRGNYGVYTIFLPDNNSNSCNNNNINASRQREEFLQNFTVIISGGFSKCPFWSSDQDNHTISVWWLNLTDFPIRQPIIGANFKAVLTNNSAQDAISHASRISRKLADSLRLSPDEPNCENATNAMITVLGSYDYNETTTEQNQGSNSSSSSTVTTTKHKLVHDFYLRVANEATPHWTSAYYINRPSDHDAADADQWTKRSLDFKLNGLPILMADPDIFFAHVGKMEYKFDSDGNQIDSTMPTMIPPFEGDWDDNGTAAFWTGAHPAGVRALHHDFRQGFVGMLSFIVVSYLASLYFSIFATGASRLVFLIVAIVLGMLWTVFPIGFFITATVCFTNAATNDAGELNQPVTCLMTSKTDIQPFFIYACVIFGLAIIAGLGGLTTICCNCCDSSEDCCSDCCCSSCCCGSCCGSSECCCFKCLDQCCSAIGDCCKC